MPRTKGAKNKTKQGRVYHAVNNQVSTATEKLTGPNFELDQSLYDILPSESGTNLDGIRLKVFLDRYSHKDEKGNPTEQSPEQMWRRVSVGIASVEKTSDLRALWASKFYQTLKDFKFVPAGRILSGAGTGYEVTFYNCFVIPSPHDSRGGIIDNLKTMVEIMSRSGGVGINLSSLRPRGSRVKKVNGTASGPVNWAELYSVATHDVIQQGGSRRGALMLMMNDWHPDVEEFITVKQDLNRINGANLSVCVSDAFMTAVKEGLDWDLLYPNVKDPDYDRLWDGDIKKWQSLGKEVEVWRTVKAREIWDLICDAAWRSAEPGLVFIERYNKMSNTWYYENIISVNPCGEQGLPAWGVCNLGAMNLSAFVTDGEMDYDALYQHSKVAMRFLDNVVDANYYFYEENERQQKSTRRTGLGTMGLGDALIKMKVRYGSEESLKIIEKIYKTIRDASYEQSAEIAQEKGAFPMFDKEKYLQGMFIKQLPTQTLEKISRNGIRNAVILTQAPTGTTSLLAGVSSGIEPVYDFAMIRRDRTGEHVLYHPLYEEWKKNHPNEETPNYFASANDLTPEDHVRTQAVIQKYTDSSISKTVNAPNTHTVEDVKNLYTLAYELGCKGITYMRDGSRDGVLTHINEKKENAEPSTQQVTIPVELRARPDILFGASYKVKTPVGTAFVTINSDEDGRPFEVFINVGKAGSDITADAEAMGRLISLAFRIPSAYSPKAVAEEVVLQLRGIGGSDSLGFGPGRVRSLADAVAKVVEEHIKNISETPVTTPAVQEPLDFGQKKTSLKKDLCPSCGSASLVYEEGCGKCYNCGFSKC